MSEPPIPTEPETTPEEYVTGTVLQNPNDFSIAVRTSAPEDPYTGHAWGVMTIDRGGHYATWSEVKEWSVLNIPPSTGPGDKESRTDKKENADG